jgi:hypothetical protein
MLESHGSLPNDLLTQVMISEDPPGRECQRPAQDGAGLGTEKVETSYRVLKECGPHLGGVHFELTGENVTECLGGASGVTEADLTRDYRTQLDPRLNYEQSMEMALVLARLMSKKSK